MPSAGSARRRLVQSPGDPEGLQRREGVRALASMPVALAQHETGRGLLVDGTREQAVSPKLAHRQIHCSP